MEGRRSFTLSTWHL